MRGVDSCGEGGSVGTGGNQVLLGGMCFGGGVDAGIRCCMVPAILIGLDEPSVMRISMLGLQSKQSGIDDCMFLSDGGENVVEEDNMLQVDVHDGRATGFEGGIHQTMTCKGGVNGGERVTIRYSIIVWVERCSIREWFRLRFRACA